MASAQTHVKIPNAAAPVLYPMPFPAFTDKPLTPSCFNMATNEILNNDQIESIVNRWLVDYYLLRSIDFFQKEQYADFRGVRDVLDRVLNRPLESADNLPTKILLLQFLSRINEGENLDLLFESDNSICPLESALIVLEKLNTNGSVPQKDFENVLTSLKEMIVVIYIKNDKFDSAKEVLKKHFPKPMVGKKAIFMGLIRQKSKAHEVIEQIDFQQFKKEMLTFCLRLCSFSVPFLHLAAKALIDKKLEKPDDQADDDQASDEHDEPGPCCRPQINIIPFVLCKHSIIQRARLEVAYKALAVRSDERTFAQLEEEVEREEQTNLCLRLSPTSTKDNNSEQDGLFQRDSGSPMEASPADQPPQTDAVPETQAGSLSKTPSVQRKRRLYTVARLVVEPDSQCSSQCTAASQDLETEVRTEESPAIANKKDLQSPVLDIEVTVPARKRPRRGKKTSNRSSTSLVEISASDDEGPSGSVANRETSVEKLHNQSNSLISKYFTKSKQLSSESEEDPQESPAPRKTRVLKTRKQLASNSFSKDPGDPGDVCIQDSSLDSSPELFPHHPVPQTSSTPQKDSAPQNDSAQDKRPSDLKWKRLYDNAKESKETWSDEESLFSPKVSQNDSNVSNSGHKRKMWTDSETQRLKEGVKRFGEGNWGKIKAYYSFKDRTNVNIKDRWRTMKRLNMI